MFPRLLPGMVLLAGLTLLVPAISGAPVPPPRIPKKIIKPITKDILGTWKMVSTTRVFNGIRTVSKLPGTTHVRIDGLTWEYIYPNRPAAIVRPATSMQVQLDATQPHPTMDLVRPGFAAPFMQGIVRVLEDNKLEYCYISGGKPGVTRPTSFEPGEGQILMTLERVSP